MADQRKINLPFEHTIVGLLTADSGRVFIAWERTGAAHNFGTHELYANGACETGHYFHGRREAIDDLQHRAGFRRDKEKRHRRRRGTFADVSPSDIDPETGAPYENYSSPCLEPHAFDGRTKAGEY